MSFQGELKRPYFCKVGVPYTIKAGNFHNQHFTGQGGMPWKGEIFLN
jgi:hypothetical protein